MQTFNSFGEMYAAQAVRDTQNSSPHQVRPDVMVNNVFIEDKYAEAMNQINAIVGNLHDELLAELQVADDDEDKETIRYWEDRFGSISALSADA